MECAELHPSGGSNAAISEEDAKPFTTQFQQHETSPPSPQDKKFLVPVLNGTSPAPGSADGTSPVPGSAENRTLLSGCDTLPAWSAVIHRPAEDSEPDELPSTVDMDAIKGSPPTPKVPYVSNEPWGMSGGDRDASDSSSDDESDDDSSGSGSRDSGSDADGSVSSSCSWTDDEGSSGGRDDSSDDSCSSSSSSSASSYSSASRASTATPQQTFSIRETNFEQGGLKLKIAAMTVRPSDDSSSKTSSSLGVPKSLVGVPKEVVSATPVPKSAAATVTSQTPTNPTPDKKTQIASPSMSRLRPRRKEEPAKGATSGSSQAQRSGSKREPQSHAAGPSSSAASRTERGNGQPGGETAISQLAQELSGDALQEINQEDLAAILPDVSTPEGPNDDVAGPPFDVFEDVSSLSGKAEIGAAGIVAASSVVASQPQPEAESSSEDMELLPEQVVSAAIQRIHLDEDTASCTEGGTESGLTRSRERAESFSSQDGEDEASDVETKSPRTSTRVYSSRLLQQFEQKTAMLSQGDKSGSRGAGESGSTCLGIDSSAKQQTKESKTSPNSKHRRPRGRPPKNPVVETEETTVANKGCSIGELDVFMPLDCCNVSNVSPDSGIQSVAGSPVHQSCSPASNHASPSHTAMPLSTSPPPPIRHSSPPPKPTSPTPLQSETKRRPGRPPSKFQLVQKQKQKQKQKKRKPGRPKGSVGKKISTPLATNLNSSNEQRPERGTLETELPGYVPSMAPLVSSSTLASQPTKRGPGRPKKVVTASECGTQVSPLINNTSKKTNISGKGDTSGKSASPERQSVANKPPDSFLSRRAKKERGLKLKNKDGKRNKTKFGIDKRKLRKGLATGRKRWRTNNIKALTVPFHLANDAVLTVAAVSQMNSHKFSSKLAISKRKRSSHNMQSYHSANHKIQDSRFKIQQLRKGHKIFTHHKGRDQLVKRKLIKSSAAHILAQNKEKKKKKKNELSPKQQDDPDFLNSLDDLMSSLRKCSISRTLTLPAPGDGRLPSIFRVRRLLKRRKGSDRSKNSDKESESEAISVAPPKSPHQASKEKSKRKNKKSAVEPPKRAEPNEQRLPLKKRHYHLTNQQPSASEAVVTPISPPLPAAICVSSNTPTTASTQTPLRSEKTATGARVSRNSIDDAIEACISRYSVSKSSTPNTQVNPEKVTAVVTPKKRHKTEDKIIEPEYKIANSNVIVTPKSQTSPLVPAKRSAAARSCNTSKSSENMKDASLPTTAEKLKDSPVKVEVKTEVVESKQPNKELTKKSKKKKNIKDLRMQMTKFSESDMILKKAVASVKKKVKRRKTINRTGFPIKRKKKPKSHTELSNRTNTNQSGPMTNGIAENERKTKQNETPIKETNCHTSKSGKVAAGKRKHDASMTEDMPLPLHQHISKRLRGCKDDDVASTTEEMLPLMPILSESLYPADVPSGDESSKSGKKKQPPRWRKKYLVAGLFSDYYKEDETKKSSGSGEVTVTKSRSFVYKPEEHIHGLLPPPYHCGKYLRQRRVDFQLPHDLWWLHVNNQLPGRDSVPSWNYKKIRTNVYYDVKPPYNNEAQACNCTLPPKPSQIGCGDDCINRLVYTECSSQLCPCKERCANQKVQKHDWAPGIEKFMTKDKGWGVRTKKNIKNGDFILEYVGEVVSEKEFKNRMASRYSHDTHHYCLHLDGGLVIDGHRMGGDGRFVNHSCEPNCEMQKWSVNGLFRMALFALRDIEPGEELGYDYNFSLFNPAEGQPCKCGSTRCRGVIGGKSQRVTLPTGDDKNGLNGDKKGRLKHNSRKSKIKHKKFSKSDSNSLKHQIFTPMKPMSHQQRCFAQMHHCFLLRNLEKVKRLRDRLKVNAAGQQETLPPGSANYGRPAVVTTKASDVFLAQLNALSTPRSMRTRRLAQAEDNPELTRVARLAYVFKDLYQLVCAAKDEKGDLLAAPFVMLPPKRKVPLYYEKIQEPIDLAMLEKSITSGLYKSVDAFDEDIFRLFNNNVRFYGRTSELGIAAARLRKVYCDAKNSFQPQLDDILGDIAPSSCSSDKPSVNVGKVGIASSSSSNNKEKEEEEEVIRCICGLYMDEGLMIQCERCLVWQHADCVQADSSVDHYLCEFCVPRQVNKDILMNPKPEYAQNGETHYISLMRENLQLRQGDTVYVLRDIVRDDIDDPSLPPQKHTYKTLTNGKPEDCDIFRIERLYTDEKGDRFAFGHHYLRPHETYHEPTRRFFPNEVMRVPLYEVVPFDLVLGQCWVLDLPTFCKGRPIGAKEEHVYVCEFRVDKTAHLFARLAPRTAKQSVAQLCMKPYAFEVFHTRLKPQRTYTPHGGTSTTPRPRSKSRPHGEDDACSSKSDASKTHSQQKQQLRATLTQQPPGVKRAKQKLRLNGVLLNLLDKQQCKQPLDVSYLLEPNRRQRKKPTSLMAS